MKSVIHCYYILTFAFLVLLLCELDGVQVRTNLCGLLSRRSWKLRFQQLDCS